MRETIRKMIRTGTDQAIKIMRTAISEVIRSEEALEDWQMVIITPILYYAIKVRKLLHSAEIHLCFIDTQMMIHVDRGEEYGESSSSV